MKCQWKKYVDSIGGVQYNGTITDDNGEIATTIVIYKGYSNMFRRVMYSYLSTYKTTLREIKQYAEQQLLNY